MKFSLGQQPYAGNDSVAPTNSIVDVDGQRFHRIDGVDAMPPFFLTVVSGGDRWLYATSRGVLTAGRRSPTAALFPYETDGRLLAGDASAGPRTVVFATAADGATRRWEPQRYAGDGVYRLRRSLAKSTLGDELRLEERNLDLGLTMRQSWRSGRRFGFVRSAEIHNEGDAPVRLRLLDGLVSVMAADIDRGMQAHLSTLVDAYRLTEWVADGGVALFRLNSIPVDRATPNEALRAHAAWLRGLPAPTVLLSARQLDAFRRGGDVMPERTARGVPGALLVVSEFELRPGERRQWLCGVDGALDAAGVVALCDALGPAPELGQDLRRAIAEDLDEDRQRLVAHLVGADGVQHSGDGIEDARHCANTLNNILRGGTFVDRGDVCAEDFARYLREVAPQIAARVSLASLPARLARSELVAAAAASGDVDYERLAVEYLPLTFSRRHGDPSRPWNDFCIDTHDDDGGPRFRYEGNWRDIFQNWEALLHSYPAYVEAAIVKFANASTADGYNPYRISREGVDWEVPDADDPWAHIGYWGDHQIVYLQRLLRLAEEVAPGRLAALLRRPVFVFVDVPYRIADYDALLRNPFETIAFDADRDREIRAAVAVLGNEARLVRGGAGPEGEAVPRRATLAEKLLIPVLAKLGNFVAGGGIWLNTQRPEWNDANNALVGRGVSVVTAAHLSCHVGALRRLVASAGDTPVGIARAVVVHLRAVRSAFAEHHDVLSAATPAGRRALLDALGRAASEYRAATYRGDVGARLDLDVAEVHGFLEEAQAWLTATVRANRRADGLLHAYNRLSLQADGGIAIERLPVMLEGQVAALASGALTPIEAADLLDALRASPLWRDDLGTYMLYPDRPTVSLLDRGVIPPAALDRLSLLRALLDAGDRRILRRDARGVVRFAPAHRNRGCLQRALAELAATAPAMAELIGEQGDALLELYDDVFEHAAFTGRSCTFFGYEGLGSVYWHMVSKLRLAVLETLAATDPASPAVPRLQAHARALREGLGVGRSPAEYGALPSDPYSHTPAHGGARQPGMTGQVKEDLVARRLELGVRFEEGAVRFVASDQGPVRFSVCGVPVERTGGDGPPEVVVTLADGAVVRFEDGRLDPQLSASLLARDGRIARIDVR